MLVAGYPVASAGDTAAQIFKPANDHGALALYGLRCWCGQQHGLPFFNRRALSMICWCGLELQVMKAGFR